MHTAGASVPTMHLRYGMNDKTLTVGDWALYRRAYRRSQRMNARSALRAYFGRHTRCAFDIRGRSMSGREIVISVGAASDATLRLFHDAAQQHRKNR